MCCISRAQGHKEGAGRGRNIRPQKPPKGGSPVHPPFASPFERRGRAERRTDRDVLPRLHHRDTPEEDRPVPLRAPHRCTAPGDGVPRPRDTRRRSRSPAPGAPGAHHETVAGVSEHAGVVLDAVGRLGLERGATRVRNVFSASLGRGSIATRGGSLSSPRPAGTSAPNLSG